MNQQNNISESAPVPIIEIEPEFAGFTPQEFIIDPVGYFEREGKNIKKGERMLDEQGVVREDPTAVKDFPVWKDAEGAEIQTVGKRVNANKGAMAKSGNPFYEYEVMQKVGQMKLPVARLVAKAEQSGVYLIVMERIPGVRWSELDSLNLRGQGYSVEDIVNLRKQAEQVMNDMKIKFELAGFVRGWKLKDMVMQIDVANKKVAGMVPTDWERTKFTSI